MYTLAMDIPTLQNSLCQFLFHSDIVLESLGKYEEDNEAQSLLREKRYAMKELKDEVTYRTISHWCDMGLVLREKGNNWLKLNIVDLVWIKIIAKLRKFGLSIEAIDKIKRCVFFVSPERNELMYFLDLYIVYALERKPVGLFINDKFEAILCFEKELDNTKKRGNTIPSHIFISLNEIVIQIFSSKELKPIYEIRGVSLNLAEMRLLLYLRSGKYDEITVRLNDGKVALFEGLEKIDTSMRVIDIIKQAEYQDIEIKVAGNKILKVTRKEKKKL